MGGMLLQLDRLFQCVFDTVSPRGWAWPGIWNLRHQPLSCGRITSVSYPAWLDYSSFSALKNLVGNPNFLFKKIKLLFLDNFIHVYSISSQLSSHLLPVSPSPTPEHSPICIFLYFWESTKSLVMPECVWVWRHLPKHEQPTRGHDHAEEGFCPLQYPPTACSFWARVGVSGDLHLC